MQMFLALTLFVAAAQASPLIPRDVEVSMYPRLAGQERNRAMAAQQTQAESIRYQLGSVPQSPHAGWTYEDAASRIINGTEARRGQFPWQVAVVAGLNTYCGGSIISEKWILSAASCASGSTKFHLTMGAINKKNPEFGSYVVRTRDVIVHDSYSPLPKISYDIALFKLATPIQFSTYMSPVKLPALSFTTSLTGAEMRVSGWGTTTEGTTPAQSDILNFVDVTGISNEDCLESYGDIITSRNICTMVENGETVCYGDDGGALVYQLDDGRYSQVGIASFVSEDGCTKAPAAYTQVTSYLKWIQSKTNIAIDK